MESLRGYLGLVGAVIRSGMDKESSEYPLTTDGRYWCSLGNLDPDYVFRRVNTSHGRTYVQTAKMKAMLSGAPIYISAMTDEAGDKL